MNIRDLKYLVAVADFQHFGKAAEACFVSQPALSMQIKKLEDSLGLQLIERTNKRILFTEIGLLIVKQAREVLHQVECLNQIANQFKDPFTGELHLGLIPTSAPYLLPLVIPALSQEFPKLRFHLVEDTTANLITKIDEGKLDAALLALPIEGDFVVEPLFNEEFVLAVPLNHPMAGQTVANFYDLEQKALMLLEDGHCLREQALAVCHLAHATEVKNFRATSLETLRHMVAAGAGITLMPKLSCRPNDGIHYLSFSSKAPMRSIGLIWRKTSAKKLVLAEIAELIKSIVKP